MQPKNATINNLALKARRLRHLSLEKRHSPRIDAAINPVCRILVPALLAVLGGCGSVVGDPAHARQAQASHGVQVWVTTADRSQQLARGTDVALRHATAEPVTIEIDTVRRYQAMIGFGAAITDASAWLIRSRMNGAQRAALMQELFGPAPALQISFVRLTIGASDFSPAHYSLDDMPDGETDPALAHFSIAPIRDTVVPVVRDAQSLNRNLLVMASPWSAPGWMKSSGALIHGTLLPQFYGAFANYLTKYVDAMQAQGIPIYALTMQNEPHFDTPNYPGMTLDADARAQLIGQYLGPALAQRTARTLILEWDHNWDRPQEPLQVLGNPLAAGYVAGVAWHCYAGNVAAQVQVHLAHPDKDAYLTECSGGNWGSPSNSSLLQMTRELIIGSTRAWARGVLLWNLALDQSAGPHLGGCTACRGLVTIDSRTGEVTRNDDYYVIAHASRFVRPGAVRVESNQTDSSVDNVAFQNPDDGSFVLIAANSAKSAKVLSVRCGDHEFRYTMPGESVATFVWSQPDALRYN